MKRKTRTITVNNQQYVWWYKFSENAVVIIISPIHDKTSRVTVEFPRQSNYQDENEKQYHHRNKIWIVLVVS